MRLKGAHVCGRAVEGGRHRARISMDLAGGGPQGAEKGPGARLPLIVGTPSELNINVEVTL